MTEWNQVCNNYNSAISNNLSFFNNLKNESDPAGVYFDLVNPDPIPTEDPCGCQATFNSAMAVASQEYSERVKNALRGPAAQMNRSYQAARMTFQITVNQLENALVDCIVNCED